VNHFSKQGISEELIGKAIKKYDIPREKLVILTKCNFPSMDDPQAGPFKPEHASSRDYINKKGWPSESLFFDWQD
jgi:aryl-alcohol dehydrogenase-like predicted oxidoreductase